MTMEKIQLGIALSNLISTTQNALKEIKLLLAEGKKEIKDNDLDDGCYNLVIGKYSDGSGYCGDLHRYRGNKELLEVIIDTLTKQLKRDQDEFDAL